MDMASFTQTDIIFFHPDYTVGIGVAPIQPFGSRTLPPVGNHTLP